MSFMPYGLPSAADGAAPSSHEWEPCARVRHGRVCGERLAFGTDGLGRLLPWCPVCDGGQQPSRDSVQIEARRRALATPAVELRTRARAGRRARVVVARHVVCGHCRAGFDAKSTHQVYCSAECRSTARNLRLYGPPAPRNSDLARAGLTMEHIATAVADAFGWTVELLRARWRRHIGAQPHDPARHAAVYLSREMLGFILTDIGQYFGGLDHKTVLHSCHCARGLLVRDAAFRERVASVRARLVADLFPPRA